MKPYDLSPYKLTLPTGLADHADEIKQPSLMSYQSDFFKTNGKSFVFTCPDLGAFTKTAHFPRTELRDLRDFKISDTVFDGLFVSVNKLAIGEEVIIHQIHDDNEPVYFTCWTQDDATTGSLKLIYRTHDGDAHKTQKIKGVFPNKTPIKLAVEYTPAAVLVRINNALAVHLPMARTGKGGDLYWKRGAYYQSNAGLGHTCEVEHQ